MPRYICHHDGKFFEWSTVVDAPVTHAMTREDFEEHYRFQYGREAMRKLPERVGRAIAHGCSAVPSMSLAELFAGNRAGDDETEATFDEIIAAVNAPPEPETPPASGKGRDGEEV